MTFRKLKEMSESFRKRKELQEIPGKFLKSPKLVFLAKVKNRISFVLHLTYQVPYQ